MTITYYCTCRLAISPCTRSCTANFPMIPSTCTHLRSCAVAARANPGKFNSGLVPGLTEFTFWAYTHHENLNITQVPYRDINLAPTELAEGRIPVVMESLE